MVAKIMAKRHRAWKMTYDAAVDELTRSIAGYDYPPKRFVWAQDLSFKTMDNALDRTRDRHLEARARRRAQHHG